MPPSKRGESPRYEYNKARRAYLKENGLLPDMKDYMKIWYRKNRTNQQIYNMWNHCKRRAHKKNLPCTITIDDISIPAECPILGIPIRSGHEVICENSPTVDQIEIGKGYTPENIQIISNLANRMKNNGTLEQCVLLGKWAEAKLNDLAKESLL